MTSIILQVARQRLAETYAQTYSKNAILNGDWDTGFLIKRMVEQVEREMLAKPVEADAE